MVMEASPSPQSVGREFVRQYYTLLNKAPAHLHRFYNNYSSFVHGGLDSPNRETLPVVGQKQIHNRIQQLNFRDCHAKISQVDSQATLGNGVVVQVTGELSNGGAPMRRFTQTFVLAAQAPKKYYVHNDIFRYQDIVFSDEEGSGSGRSEGEEEEGGGGAAYFPGGGFPAPPSFPPHPPHAPAATAAPAAAHLNGLPHQHDDSTRHLVAALQATNIGGSSTVEPEPERPESASPTPTDVGAMGAGGTGGAAAPEPEPAPSPPPAVPAQPPQPAHQSPPQPASTEPKTYANLLKSGAGFGARGSPPSAGAPPSGAASAPPAASAAPAATAAPPAPAAPEPRPPRPRHTHNAPQHDRQPADSGNAPTGGGNSGGSRRYSDTQQLFLGNLPHSATEDELRALFARFGPVADLRVHSKPAAAGQPRHPNYGFITYETAQAAAECLNAAPLYFPSEGAEGAVKLNVEEKKTRGRDGGRRRGPSAHRDRDRQFRAPYRR